MHFLRSSIGFFLKSSLFIGLCAVAFVLSGEYLLAGSLATIGPYPLLGVGCATFIIYNLTLFLEELQLKNKKGGKEVSWLQQNARLMYPLLLLAVVALCYSLLLLPLKAILFLLHLALLSVLYTIPDSFAQSNYYSLRSIPLFKIFLIAYVWAAMGSFLPYLLEEGVHPAQSLQLFVVQFMFILAITLPFDIRDYDEDKKRGLLTIPGLIGLKLTRWLAVLLMLIFAGLMGIWFSATVLPSIALAGVGLLLVMGAHPGRPYWYFTGLLDGMILLQLILLIVF